MVVIFSVQLWLCLAALCVIDEEHAEALSSGQWLGQDGKPKDKVTLTLPPSLPPPPPPSLHYCLECDLYHLPSLCVIIMMTERPRH